MNAQAFWIDAAWWAGTASSYAARILIIYVSWRDRTYGVPMVAMVSNLSTAFLFTFIYKADDPQVALDIAKFSVNLVILSMFLRFWRSDFPQSLRVYVWPILLGCVTLAMALQIAITEWLGSYDGAVYTAYGNGLLTSALFLVMLQRRGTTRGQSAWIGILKMLANASWSISYYFFDPTTITLHVMSIATFLLDALYVWLLMRAPRWQRPTSEKP